MFVVVGGGRAEWPDTQTDGIFSGTQSRASGQEVKNGLPTSTGPEGAWVLHQWLGLAS